MGVDGTDFQVYCQKGSYKFWYDFKFKKPGVRYKVGVSIVNGDIVWINGPFLCGHFNDNQHQRFRNCMEIALQKLPVGWCRVCASPLGLHALEAVFRR